MYGDFGFPGQISKRQRSLTYLTNLPPSCLTACTDFSRPAKRWMWCLRQRDKCGPKRQARTEQAFGSLQNHDVQRKNSNVVIEFFRNWSMSFCNWLRQRKSAKSTSAWMRWKWSPWSRGQTTNMCGYSGILSCQFSRKPPLDILYSWFPPQFAARIQISGCISCWGSWSQHKWWGNKWELWICFGRGISRLLPKIEPQFQDWSKISILLTSSR